MRKLRTGGVACMVRFGLVLAMGLAPTWAWAGESSAAVEAPQGAPSGPATPTTPTSAETPSPKSATGASTSSSEPPNSTSPTTASEGSPSATPPPPPSEADAATPSATVSASAPPPHGVLAVPQADERKDRFRALAITLNPLMFMFKRVGVNAEYLPWRHHGVMIYPYYQATSAEEPYSLTSYQLGGLEVGYHFYTGERGANGFFIGPSFIAMYGKYDFREINRDNFKTESNGTFTSYGGAIDAGLQHVFLSGVTVGLGVGAMFLKSSTVEFFKNVPTTTTFDGLKSRVLLTMGYSF